MARDVLHHIGVGRRYAGSPVLVLVLGLHIRVLGELLRDLTHARSTTAASRAG